MTTDQNGSTNEPILERPGSTAPSSPPPDPSETRRVQITRDLIGGQLSPADRAARLEELRRIVSDSGAVALEDAKKSEVEAKASPLERKRQALARDPEFLKGNPAKVAEMKQILAAQSAEENPQARAEMSLDEKRAEFGLVPEFVTEGGAEAWNTDAEAEVLDYAHSVGLSADVLRDGVAEYIKLREVADGPMADEDLDALEKKYQARGVPAAVTKEYRRWLREQGYA